MRAVLVDAGPLVALLDRGDAEHEVVTAALKELDETLVTVWPKVTEAMYLLGFSRQAQDLVWDMLVESEVGVLPLAVDDFPSMRRLMAKYESQPTMDLADAALVHVAGREGLDRILTIDRRDFAVYRTEDGRALKSLPPVH